MEQKAWIRKQSGMTTAGQTESCCMERSLEKSEIEIREKNGVTYLAFPALDATGLVSHAFSTRHGGVSEGVFSSMNFSFTRNDDPQHVMENYRRMAAVLGTDAEKMVLSYQTHTTNVRKVTEEDAGKGIVKERDYQDVDGLITDIPGITLVTFYADCVPLLFVDPVRRAVGLSHSGWRGTAQGMGARTAEAMRKAFGSRPEDLLVGIGPSICRDCYEVSEDVADAFRMLFSEEGFQNLSIRLSDVLSAKGNGKYQLDLWKANEAVCLSAGIQPQHISVTDVCTCCNPEFLFSHRASHGRRGNLGAFLGIR